MKVHALGAELFHMDGRARLYVTKLLVAFPQFCERASKLRLA